MIDLGTYTVRGNTTSRNHNAIYTRQEILSTKMENTIDYIVHRKISPRNCGTSLENTGK